MIEYAKLSLPQKWEWHAEVYGFRRVVLRIAHDERTSPVDPDGRWFDDRLADAAEQRLRAKFARASRVCAESTSARNAIRFADAEQWRSSAGRMRARSERFVSAAAALGAGAREERRPAYGDAE